MKKYAGIYTLKIHFCIKKEKAAFRRILLSVKDFFVLIPRRSVALRFVVKDHGRHIPFHRRLLYGRDEIQDLRSVVDLEVFSCAEEQAICLAD